MLRKVPTRIILLLLSGIFGTFTPAFAQHPIEVQRQEAQGRYFDALVTYDKMPKRVATLESKLSAAKSAWALGLPDRAIAEFDQSLRDENLNDVEKARIYLSRGIIEFQEHRHQVAILFAEKSVNLLPDSSPLRSKAWLLWGEALYELGSYGTAEEKFSNALLESGSEEKADIHFRLGLCNEKLGKYDLAKKYFEKIPRDHERTAQAMRHLAQVSLRIGNYDHARFWLAEGRKNFPDQFLDSWVDYALLSVAVHERNMDEVKSIREKANTAYPPSDNWLVLLNAAAEEFEWKGSSVEGRAGLKREEN